MSEHARRPKPLAAALFTIVAAALASTVGTNFAHAHEPCTNLPGEHPTDDVGERCEDTSTPETRSATPPDYTFETTATRTRAPEQEWSVAAQDNSPAARTAADAARRIPGIVVQRHATEGKGEQFLARGFDAGHGTDVEVLVGGMPINLASHVHGHGYVDLATVPTIALGELTWTPGSFDASQGPFATAGTLEYSFADTPWSELRIGLSTTLRTSLAFRVVDPEEPSATFAAGEILQDRGYGESRAVERGNFIASRRLIHDGATHLEFLFGFSAARFDVPSFVRRSDIDAGSIDFHGAYDGNGDGLATTVFVALPFEHRTRNRWRLRGSAMMDARSFALSSNTTGYLEDPVNGDTRSLDEERLRLRGTIRARKVLHRDWQLELIAGSSFDALGRQDVQADLQGNPLEEGTRFRDDRVRLYGAHFAAAVRWYATRNLSIDASLRTDVSGVELQSDSDRDASDNASDTTARGSSVDVAISPRVRARYDVGDAWSLQAAWGRGFRPFEADALLKPQSTGATDTLLQTPAKLTVTDHVELSAGTSTDRLTLRAAAFGVFSSNEFFFDHVSRTTVDLGATRRLGVELALTAEPVDWLTLSAAGLVVRGTYLESGRAVPNVPVFSGTASAVVRVHRQLRIGTDVEFASRRDLLFGASAKSFARWNADATFTHRQFTWRLGIENLLNSDIAESEYQFASNPMPGGGSSRLPALHVAAAPGRIVSAEFGLRF